MTLHNPCPNYDNSAWIVCIFAFVTSSRPSYYTEYRVLLADQKNLENSIKNSIYTCSLYATNRRINGFDDVPALLTV